MYGLVDYHMMTQNISVPYVTVSNQVIKKKFNRILKNMSHYLFNSYSTWYQSLDLLLSNIESDIIMVHVNTARNHKNNHNSLFLPNHIDFGMSICQVSLSLIFMALIQLIMQASDI